VIDSPAGDGKTAVRLPAVLKAGGSFGSGRGARHLEAEERSPREDGAELFRAIFKGEVRERWLQSLAKLAEGRGLRLRLRLEGSPELVGLPWECLYDPDHKAFLALKVETPVVRYLEVAVEPLPLQAPVPLRMLVVTANPHGTEPLNIEREIREIKSALAPLGSRVQIELLDRPSLADLEGRLQECHVLHFIGHGSFDELSGSGTLLLEGRNGQARTIDVDDLAGLLPQHHGLRLVVLNACQGARHSDRDAFSGVAQGLVQKGVPAVVAMRHDIADEAAILFAGTLYKSLARGAAIDEAVTFGRKAISSDHGDTWATPALYLRQDVEVLPRPRPIWPWVVALIAFVMILGALAKVWIPPFITSWECPSPPGLDMKFAYIPPGTFQMGSTRNGDGPVHPVTLTRPFCLGVYEVTQRQWTKVMGTNPSATRGDDYPVENVSWDDAHRFLEKLAARDPGRGFGLATEAQWEYAASGGGTKRYELLRDGEKGLQGQGNCASRRVAPVGSFQATRWGLHDMLGNVSEWVEDFGTYPRGPVTDPVGGPRQDEERVRRGGSFASRAVECLPTTRTLSLRNYQKFDTGFRVVRKPVH